ncbi:hypothetical protein DRQ53_02675 [bacterium]|nr:MAG: hypothetical protein DRQ32_12215 [bacterium]RKZ17712.1 MAG: hypothetical protein DRQ53_02675 [bacterium]
MKSQFSIILALLVLCSVGFVAPADAGDDDAFRTFQVELTGQVIAPRDSSPAGGAEETDGDPDGWLGGQNVRPAPPIIKGEGLGFDPGGGLFERFFALFLMYIGIG